jgi:L-arabinose isomerase
MARVKALGRYEVWFVAGSQHLYGDEVLRQVDEHAHAVAAALDAAGEIPVRFVPRGVVTTPESIRRLCLEATAADDCVGLVAWMHTFSPAKMWIAGLRSLSKPLLHLHTQFNRDLPWAEIDMDFMNLNQSAHGDREFGHVLTRLGVPRKTVVGHWQDPAVLARVGTWARAACGWREAQTLSVARFGDNMRQVAVTEGDKVEAQAQLGFSVNGFGVGELVAAVEAVAEADVDALLDEYDEAYAVAPELRVGGGRRESLRDAARIEAGLRAFLESGGFGAFTDTFEDLGSLAQLPGIGAQRLMADGYGFGAEGDWKTAALLRVAKTMAAGLSGGTSFMEDYTYHLDPAGPLVLGAHMLEICPSIAAERPSCEIHPLSIGGKADPVRLVFTAPPGPGVVATLVDLGDRFRLIVNEIDVVEPPEPLPKLPVARALWRPRPDLASATEAWLAAGGAHHTVFTQALGVEAFADLAAIAGLELLVIA